MNSITVIDTETVSLDGPACEIAGVVVDVDQNKITSHWSELVDPKEPISFGAMGIHHIDQSMVSGKPLLDDVLHAHMTGVEVVGAHNAAFDRQKVPEPVQDLPWICTMRCAKHLFRSAEGYGNQSLRYELGVDLNDMPAEAGNLVHRALFDAWTTAKILLFMLQMHGVDRLIELTATPVVLNTVGFGKHFGAQWSDVPRDYLQWVSKQDFDEDTLHTAKHYAAGGLKP